MSTQRVTSAQLRSMAIGSLARHEELQAGLLTFLRLNGVPARAIHTGPRVRPRPGGGYDLKRNTEQHGVSDVMACLPPLGRLALLECKSGQAKRTREQIALHREFTAAGALCLVVRDLRDVEPYMPIGRGRLQGHGGTT